MPRDVATFLASGLALGLLALGGWRAWTLPERDREEQRGLWLYEDQSRMRQLAALFAQSPELPMRDGALDPYFFVRNGDITEDNIELLGSLSLGFGPTIEEALRGDYTNFPWQRYRGTGTRVEGRALLWGREPWKGRTIVGYSDGSARIFGPEDLDPSGMPPEALR